MSGERRKFLDCAPRDIEKLLRRIGGFEIADGAKHIKATHTLTGKRTTIPRHTRVNPHIVRDIVEKLLIDELKYPAALVYENIDC